MEKFLSFPKSPSNHQDNKYNKWIIKKKTYMFLFHIHFTRIVDEQNQE